MTTLFPQQIDSFSIRAPQEVIRAVHMNDVQDAIVKIQIFVLALEESLNNHLLTNSSSHLASTIDLDSLIDGYSTVQQALEYINSKHDQHVQNLANAHSAAAISVDAIAGVITTNLQITLQNLKDQIDQLDLTDTDLALFNAHVASSITDAHSGQLPGSRIVSGTITNTQIATGTISEDRLAFATVSPSILNAHTSQNIEDAHSGIFPIARLDTPIATESMLTTHTLATLDVHGIGSTSAVVGTNTQQTLQNKKIISDFQGSKIVLFTTTVDQVEKDLFNSTNLAANQLEIRQKSTATIISVDGTQTFVTVPDGSFFSDAIGIANAVEFFSSLTFTSLGTGSISEINSNTLTLTSPNLLISANDIVVNNLLSTPLFSVDSTGLVDIKQLNVQSGMQDIQLQNDVTIEGNLEVTESTILNKQLEVKQNATILGTLSAQGFSTSNSSTNINSSSVNIANTTSFGNSIIVNNNSSVVKNQVVGKDLQVAGNATIDGYLNVGQSAGILGSLIIADFLSSGGPAYIEGSLNVVDHTTIQDDLEIYGDISIRGGMIAEGYSTIKDDLVVEGDLYVLGTYQGRIEATEIEFLTNDAYNLLLNSPLTKQNLQEIPIELQENLEKHSLSSEDVHGTDGYIVGTNNTQTLYNKTLQSSIIEGYTQIIGSTSMVGSLSIYGDQYISNNLMIDNDLEVSGDLWIRGTTTTIDTTNLLVKDNNIRLNKDGTDSTAQNSDGYGAGLSIEGSSGSTLATLQYDNTLPSKFKLGENGSESEILTSSTIQTITGQKTFANTTLIDVNSTFPALKLTQSGVGDTLLVEDQTTDTTPFVIKSDGYVGIQTSLPSYELDVAGRVRADYFLTNSESTIISANTISISKGLVVLTSGSQLDTINNLSNGLQLIIVNNTGSVILITNSGNISTGTGRDFRLANTSAALVVFSSLTNKAQLIGGGGGSDAWEVISSSKTLEVGLKYFADTSGGAISLTLPSTPQTGETIAITDPTGSWSTNNITILGNGKTINNSGASSSNLTINTSWKTYTLVYYAPSSSWIIIKGASTYGG